MKTSLIFLFLLAFSIQLMSQAVNLRTDKSPGDIAITSIQHPCVGTVNGVDTTMGYFSALPLDQVWPIQLSALIVNLGSTDQTNVVLTGEIVNEHGTVVFTSSLAGGDLITGASINLTLPDLFLPTETGSYTLRMSVIQDEGDYDLTNNEMTRLIIEVNANGVISRIFEMNAMIEIPTGAGAVSSNAGIKFAISNPAEILSISIFIDTFIQPQTFLTPFLFDWSGVNPLVQVIGEPYEITSSSNNSWVDLPLVPVSSSDLLLYSHRQYLVTIQVQNYSGIASIGADNADFHEFDVESFFDGYLTVQSKIPAIKINLKYNIGAEIPNLVDDIHIYPNPITDILHIQLANQVKSIFLCNILGETLQVIDNPVVNGNINFGGLPNGVYILKFINQDNSLKEFMVVKK